MLFAEPRNLTPGDGSNWQLLDALPDAYLRDDIVVGGMLLVVLESALRCVELADAFAAAEPEAC